MARYGLVHYGGAGVGAVYGAPNPTAFSVEPFKVMERNYGWLDLSWSKPGGTWSQLSLVRNEFGYPIDVNDGDLLYNAAFNDVDSSTQFSDRFAPVSRWLYYSVFIYIDADADWFRAGEVAVYSTGTYGTTELLYDRIPNVYKSGSFVPAENAALLAFMGLFGFQIDLLRSYATTLTSLDDPWTVDYDLIPLRLGEYNIADEAELGPVAKRKYLANAVFLWKTKGTRQCIQALSSIIMGCNATVEIGTNLLWTSEESDFTGGIGQWGEFTDNVVPSWNPTHVDFFGLQDASMTLTVQGTGGWEISFQNLADRMMLMALPVVPGTNYVAQVFIASSVEANDVALKFSWYDATGGAISDVTASPTTLSIGVPTPIGITAVAPAGAAYMALSIYGFYATAGVTYEVTSAQVNKGDTVLPHQPGRDVRILLEDSLGETLTEQASTDGDTTYTVSGMTPFQKALRSKRLTALLPRYLPIGATFTLVHNASAPIEYLDGDVLLVTP